MSTTHESSGGGSITILEPGSATTPMRFRMTAGRGVAPPAAECHPSQTEDFKVISGTLRLGVIDGVDVVLRAGDTYHLPAGVRHLPTAEPGTVFEATMTPGLETADMFADLFEVFREHEGFGKIVRIAMVLRRYESNISFSPAFNALHSVLSALGRLAGLEKKRAKALRQPA